MSKRMRVLMLVLAVLMIVPSILVGCGGSEDPATTTTAATTAATTTAATTTDAGTTDAGTTTAATTPAETGLDGYEFLMNVQFYSGIRSELGEGEEETSLMTEVFEIYAQIEEELDCTITCVTMDNSTEALLPASVGGIKLADFICTRQSTWIPLAMMGGIRPLDTMVEAGLDLYNEDVFNQTYTMMSEIEGPDGVKHVWAFDMTGKYENTRLGHFYAFNRALTDAAGYPAEMLFDAVRNGEWDYEMMLEIGRKTTKDLDGDGEFDQWGLALDADGNEIWTNGIRFIEYSTTEGKWVSNANHPQIMPALQFMSDISQADMQIPVFGNTVGRGDRRQLFWQGKCAFAGLYGSNIMGDENREMAGNGLWGALPLPKGPDADNYIICMVDLDTFVCQIANQDWEKSVQVINKIGAALTDWDEFKEQMLVDIAGDENSAEMLLEHAVPNAIMNIAKCSDEMYQITRKRGFFSNIYELVLTPAAAAETWQDVIQAELDNVFQQ